MVKIRLKRIGAKKSPSYRIVAMEEKVKRDGRVIDEIGHYHPKTKQPTFVNLSKIDDWVKKGAQLTTTVNRLVESYRKGGEKNETTR
ncbi:MAG: 30S ribosomal protein S16 [bacterium]